MRVNPCFKNVWPIDNTFNIINKFQHKRSKLKLNTQNVCFYKLPQDGASILKMHNVTPSGRIHQ